MGKLSKIGPPSKPFEITSIEKVGGFAGNRSPKKYMHILGDHFSRKAFISTSKSQSTTDFISLIDRETKNKEINIILAGQ